MKILFTDWHSLFEVRSYLPFSFFWKKLKTISTDYMYLQDHHLNATLRSNRMEEACVHFFLVKEIQESLVKPSPVFCILPSSGLFQGSSSSRNQSCSRNIWTIRVHSWSSLHSHCHSSTRTAGWTLKCQQTRENLAVMYTRIDQPFTQALCQQFM